MGNISNENKRKKIKKEEVFDNSNIVNTSNNDNIKKMKKEEVFDNSNKIGTSNNKNNSKNLKKEEVFDNSSIMGTSSNKNKNKNIKKEVLNDDSDIHSIDSCLYEVIKSVCKIFYPKGTGTDKGTGFFIKLIHHNNPLFCLMTCEHIITNEIIENNKTIEVYYDNQKKRIKIELNKNERFIKNFLDFNIDCTIVEILPNDNVSEDYFLLPNIDYSNNFNNLKEEKIYIPQFPKEGNLCYSKGKIKNMEGYQFSYNASTLPGSSGSPIFLIQTTYVIGLHKSEKQNYGDFIFPIIELLKKEKIQEEKNDNNNIIKEKNIISNNKINKKNEIKIIINNIIKNTFVLFGEEFIKNNGDKCEVIINGNNAFELNNLNHEYQFDEEIGEECIYVIILKETKEITDMSFMLNIHYCKIIAIDFSKWDISNVTNMKYMFKHCYNIFGISKWNVSNVKNMSHMFSKCINIPDISEWDVSNVEDMSYMFSECKNIPDISNWDVSNVKDMSYIFSECECEKIPDISEWNVPNLTNMEGMFYNSIYLTSIPDISNWDISNVKDISKIFDGCKSLKSLPDISKWNISNIIYMSYMFHNCWSLNSFPNISNWNISNVKNMSHMFHNCWSLKNIQGIENWDISNVKNMSFMFYNCSIDLNEIKKWNISKLQNSYQMLSNFDNYNSDDTMNIIFRIGLNSFNLKGIVTLVINKDMLIEDLIDKFLKKTNKIFDTNKLRFIYNAKQLNRNLSAIEVGLTNNANIFVQFR